MPIFEYACDKCSHEFEELTFNRSAKVNCPECGSKRTKKLMSGFAVTGSARKKGGGGGSCGSCKPSGGKCTGCGCH